MILLAIQLHVLAAIQTVVSVAVVQIAYAPRVEAGFLPFQMRVLAAANRAVLHALINAMLLPGFAVTHFAGLSAQRRENACSAQDGKQRFIHPISFVFNFHVSERNVSCLQCNSVRRIAHWEFH
jgi:hypothetical protein